MSKLIIGCGYLGMRAARRWLDAGESVHAVTRRDARAQEFTDLGLTPLVADVTDPKGMPDLPAVETVLYAVGFDRNAGYDRRSVYVNGLANVLAALPAETQRIIYISSTSVYGQSEGEMVDEDSACRPTTEGGRACLAAEETLRQHPLGARATILRCAGLYGPGRLPQRELLTSGRAIPSRGDTYVNLIHIDDAVEAVFAAERDATPPAMFVVADGHPVLRRDFYGRLAELLEVAPPMFDNTPRDPNRRSATNKRINPSRALRDLNLKFKHPSYKDGLAASLP